MSSTTLENSLDSAKPQRALVFQGGGALGAYEAGSYYSIYNYLLREEGYTKDTEENLFDIVVGTSIGAINATLLVDYVLRNKTWIGSHNMLWKFWEQKYTADTFANTIFF